jgi:hypothetical protein
MLDKKGWRGNIIGTTKWYNSYRRMSIYEYYEHQP